MEDVIKVEIALLRGSIISPNTRVLARMRLMPLNGGGHRIYVHSGEDATFWESRGFIAAREVGRFHREVHRCPVPALDRKRNETNTFVWPGFEAVYGAAWPSKPFATCLINSSELSRCILGADRHQAIYSDVAALRRGYAEVPP